MFTPSPELGRVDYLDPVSRVLTLVTFAIALIAVTIAPLLAIAWQQQPFPGFLVEQSLVVNGSTGQGWGPLEIGIEYPERVTRIAGQSIRTTREYNRLLADSESGSRIQVFTVSPNGEGHLYPNIELIRISGWDMVRLFWLPYLIGLAYLAIGLWIYRLRGYTRPGRALAFFCAVITIVTAFLFDVATTHSMTLIWTLALAQIGGALVSMALRFPEEWLPVQKQPELLALPYVISIAIGVWGMFGVADLAHPWAYIPRWGASYRYAGIGIIVFVVVVIYRSIASPDAVVRQQARLMAAGSVVAFLPVGIWLVTPMFNHPIAFDPLIFLPGLIVFPVSVAIAILRYRLLEIDDFVNRAFVYGASTAILAGVFAALTGLSQRLFIVMTGERSDAAIIITTLIIAAAFTPLKAQVQSIVDRRLRDAPDNTQVLRTFGGRVQDFVEMNDVDRLTERLLAEAVKGLHAESGILSLMIDGELQTVHTVGRWKNQVVLSIPLECGGHRFGLIQLGAHEKEGPYTREEVLALHQVAAQVALAVSLGWPLYERNQYREVGCPDIRPETATSARRNNGA